MTTAYTNQISFRGRGDSVALNSTTFDYSLNTGWSQNVDEPFRVRFEVQETNNKNANITGQLYYRRNGGSWTLVSATSSVVKAVASSQFSNGASTTNILPSGLGTFAGGYGIWTGVSPSSVLLSNTHLEHEYSIQIVGADVNNGDTIELEIDAGSLNAYTYVPSITAVVPVDNDMVSQDIFSGVPTIDTPTLVQNALSSQDILSGVPAIDQPTADQASPYTDYQINSSAFHTAWMAHSKVFCDGNDNLYIFFVDATTMGEVCAVKSSNGGQTWSEVDSANRPDGNGGTWGDIASIRAVQDGDVIHLASFYGTELAYHRFNTSDNASADQWAVVDTGVMAFTDTGFEYGLDICLQSDGDLLIISNGENERDFPGGECVIYHYSQNNGSTWTNDQTLSNTNGDNIGGFCVVGENNKIHLTWKGEGDANYYHQSLADVTGTPTTKEDLSDYTVPGTPNYAMTNLIYYDDDGDEKIIMVGVDDSFYPRSTFVVNDGTPAASESVVATAVFRSMEDTSSAHYTAHDLNVLGKKLYYIFSDATDQDIYLVTNDDQAGWGTPEEIINGTTAEFLSSGIYVRDGNNRLGIFWMLPTTHETRFVEIDLGAVADDNDMVAQDIFAEDPTIDQATLAQLFGLTAQDIFADPPTVDQATLDQNILTSQDAFLGVPTIDQPTANQTGVNECTAQDITSGIPTIDQATLSLIQALTSQDITSGVPAVDQSVLAQLFDLIAQDIFGSDPAIDLATLAQIFALVSQDITSGVPTIDQPTANQSGVNECTAQDITAGIPTIDQPNLILTQALSAQDITGTPGTIDEPTIAVAQALIASDVYSGVPVVDESAISQTFSLTSQDIVSGVPIIDTPTITQTPALEAQDITLGVPVIDKPSLSADQSLSAQDITMGVSVIDKPMLLDADELWMEDIVLGVPTITTGDFGMWWYTPEERVLVISQEVRTLAVEAEDRTYKIPFEDRTVKVER